LTVDAVAHGQPERPVMFGYALASMKPGCDAANNGIGLRGDGGGRTGGTFLYGGGAFSNSSCDDAVDMNGSEEQLIVSGGTIDVVGDYTGPGGLCASPDAANCNFYPAPTTGVDEVTQDPIANSPAGEPPTCGVARVLATELAGDRSIRPGSYTTLDYNNGDMVMEPGLYCLTGGTLTGRGSVSGNGVMLYLTDANASINYSGNDDITVALIAPSTDTVSGCDLPAAQQPELCTYLGIVIYKLVGKDTCEQNDVEIDFTGQASKYLEGLVYAPESLVRYGGQGDLIMVGQTIAGCVRFSGNGRIEITYDPEATFNPPPQIRLDE
jgi:hypothetical protein